MDLTIGRRELLFGSALLGIGAGASTPARACSRGPAPRLWETPFWRLQWETLIAMPRRRRALIDRFIQAVMEASSAKLDAVLAPDVLLLTPPGSRSALDAGRVLERPAAIDGLSAIVSRRGPSGFRINYLEEVDSQDCVILDVTMTGFGPYIAPQDHEPNTLCGEPPADWAIESYEWEERLICTIVTDTSVPMREMRVRQITLVRPWRVGKR
jgi:hypothetical protein